MNTSSAGAGCPNQVSMKTVDRETLILCSVRFLGGRSLAVNPEG